MLLLDEPLSGVDPASAERIAGLFGELRAEGRTLLVSSHDVEARARSTSCSACTAARWRSARRPRCSTARTLEATYGSEIIVLDEGGARAPSPSSTTSTTH